jgi:hypothetical protein
MMSAGPVWLRCGDKHCGSLLVVVNCAIPGSQAVAAYRDPDSMQASQMISCP